jgi:hypothetical protein
MKSERGQIVPSEGGQIVVEYVLLLSIALTIAMIIVSQLVKRDTDDPTNSGSLIVKWHQIQNSIANDQQN